MSTIYSSFSPKLLLRSIFIRHGVMYSNSRKRCDVYIDRGRTLYYITCSKLYSKNSYTLLKTHFEKYS